MARFILKSIFRNLLRLPEHRRHGAINFLACPKVLQRARMVLANVQGDVVKKTLDLSERQEANEFKFDVEPHTGILGAVLPIRRDLDFTQGNLIVKTAYRRP